MGLSAAPVVMLGETKVAARLLKYTMKDKPGKEGERVLQSAGIYCRPETASREFAAHRRQHGKQGAMRKSPAKYLLPEDGEEATHVRRTSRGGRKRWVLPKDGEVATHVRHEGEQVRENEAAHMIVSFGLDSVNPNDPEDTTRAFDYVMAMTKAVFPGADGESGVQAHLVGQADGSGGVGEDGKRLPGKFHVHVVVNSVVYREMTLGGKTWKPGQKISGELTEIEALRRRHDAFVAEHGAELGFELGLPQIDSPAARSVTRNARDRSMAARGEVSNHDIIRNAYEEAMDDPRAQDLDGLREVLQEHDVETNHRVTKTGKNAGRQHLSYWVPGMTVFKSGKKQFVRGETLGPHFAYEDTVLEETGEVISGVGSQLEEKAAGAPRPRPPKPYKAAAAKVAPEPTEEEISTWQASVDAMAHEEKLDAWLDDWAAEERVTVEELFGRRDGSLRAETQLRGSAEDRAWFRDLMEQWLQEKEAAEAVEPVEAVELQEGTDVAVEAAAEPIVDDERSGQPEGAQPWGEEQEDAEAQRIDELVELLPVKTGPRGIRLVDGVAVSREDAISSEDLPKVWTRWQEMGEPETDREREDQRRREREAAERAQEESQRRQAVQQALAQQPPVEPIDETPQPVAPAPVAAPRSAAAEEVTAEVAADQQQAQPASQPVKVAPRKALSARQRAMEDMRRRMAAMDWDSEAQSDQQLG